MADTFHKFMILLICINWRSGGSAVHGEEFHEGKLQVNDNNSYVVNSAFRKYPSAAATTDTNICSSIGTDVLKENGSVVDAAIAMQLCVGLVNCHSSGIGGGHFATIYAAPRNDNKKELMSVVARERAPLAADQDMFVNISGASVFGGLAIGVPGEIAGFYSAWKVYGRLPWSRLFAPAIDMCFNGLAVERSLSQAINSQQNYIRADENLSELFVKEDGSLLKEGDILINEKLGLTLRKISDDPLAFYRGDLARLLVQDIQDYNGIITEEDLQLYSAHLKIPIETNLTNGDFTLHNPPPPASGAVLDFIMNILDGYNFDRKSVSTRDDVVLTYQRIVESFKFAYAKRSLLGDEEFVDVQELVYNLTSDAYAESIRLQIDDEYTHDIEYYGPNFDIVEDQGTSHLNVLGPDGSAVALTSTVNLYFGSKCRGSRTGVIFNNQMDDFSTPGTVNEFGVPASPSNYIVPSKMPMSSMAPTLVLRNKREASTKTEDSREVIFLVGGSGGTQITTEASFVAINSLWLGKDLLNATDIGRPHHQLAPNQIVYELWMQRYIVEGLLAKNHTMVSSTGNAVIGSIRNRCPPAIGPRSEYSEYKNYINDLNKYSRGGEFDYGRAGEGKKWTGKIGGKKNRRIVECVEAISDGRKGGVPDGF